MKPSIHEWAIHSKRREQLHRIKGDTLCVRRSVAYGIDRVLKVR